MGHSLYGRKESDMSEQLTHTHTHTHTQIYVLISIYISMYVTCLDKKESPNIFTYTMPLFMYSL